MPHTLRLEKRILQWMKKPELLDLLRDLTDPGPCTESSVVRELCEFLVGADLKYRLRCITCELEDVPEDATKTEIILRELHRKKKIIIETETENSNVERQPEHTYSQGHDETSSILTELSPSPEPTEPMLPAEEEEEETSTSPERTEPMLPAEETSTSPGPSELMPPPEEEEEVMDGDDKTNSLPKTFKFTLACTFRDAATNFERGSMDHQKDHVLPIDIIPDAMETGVMPVFIRVPAEILVYLLEKTLKEHPSMLEGHANATLGVHEHRIAVGDLYGYDAAKTPTSVYPLLQPGLGSCGSECDRDHCVGPAPVNPQARTVDEFKSTRFTSRNRWWLTQNAEFHASRSADSDGYSLPLMLIRGPPHGLPVATTDAEAKPKVRLGRNQKPVNAAASKKHSDLVDKIQQYEDNESWQLLKGEPEGKRDLAVVVELSIYFHDLYNKILDAQGRPYPFAAWDKENVLDTQHERLSAYNQIGRYIKRYKKDNLTGAEAFRQHEMEKLRPSLNMKGAHTSPKALAKLLCPPARAKAGAKKRASGIQEENVKIIIVITMSELQKSLLDTLKSTPPVGQLISIHTLSK
ncbi:hypothetical protein GGX14DRAFT_387510 [Mycena pura]|uniref:Uncharacterized protein n=1 Tax=Mycena pura TaxID=153505 RepID=A0AAD7E0V5_9AGAR|nr:hypothetical protein GGX14DRAFT_387510 [Mycena pura]